MIHLPVLIDLAWEPWDVISWFFLLLSIFILITYSSAGCLTVWCSHRYYNLVTWPSWYPIQAMWFWWFPCIRVSSGSCCPVLKKSPFRFALSRNCWLGKEPHPFIKGLGEYVLQILAIIFLGSFVRQTWASSNWMALGSDLDLKTVIEVMIFYCET